MSLAPDDPRHGTTNGYNNLGCRCDACRAAKLEYVRSRGYGTYRRDACACGQPKDLRAGQCRACDIGARKRAPHGTESRYSSGCRCADCKQAMNAERARRRRTPNVRVHNRSGYTNGCRCDVCREAHRVYSAARHGVKVAAA
jgi:hypothetical protein